MKYLAFAIALFAGVPMLVALGAGSLRRRGYLLGFLAFSVVLGDAVSLNFFSTEGYRGPDRGFEITLTDLLALALALSIGLSSARRVRWAPFNTLPMAALFVFGLLSLREAYAPMLSAFTLFKGLRAYLLYWTVYNAVATGVDVPYLRRGLAAAGLWMTFFAVKQKYVEGLYRIHGTFDHSNGVPLYANLVIPALLVWAVGDKTLSRKEAIVTLASALGLVVCVVATQSRAGTLLSASIVLTTLAVARWKTPSRRVTRVSWAIVALLAMGGALAADTIVRRFQEAPESSGEAREEFNAAARDMARDHAFGVGLNNFSKALTETDAYRAHLVVMKNEEQGGVAHHIYLLTAAEMGYGALLVFVVVLGRFVVLTLARGRLNPGFDGALGIAIGVGMTALHAQGFFEWGFRVTPILYQFLIVASAGAAHTLGASSARAAALREKSRAR